MNVIFGNNRYAELVLKALEDKSWFEIDAFVVDTSFLSMEHLPVKQIAFEDFKTENSNVFIGFTFENKKGPSFLRAIVNRFSHLSCNFPGFNLASNSGKVDFGRGSQLFNNVTFDFDCKIGSFVQIRPGCSFGHDVQVGDYTYVAPEVKVGSYAEISEGCFLGFGSTIAPNTKVGKNSVIGAGAFVRGRVPDNALVIGKSSIIKKVNPYEFL